MREEDPYILPVAPARGLFLSRTKDERDLLSIEDSYFGLNKSVPHDGKCHEHLIQFVH